LNKIKRKVLPQPTPSKEEKKSVRKDESQLTQSAPAAVESTETGKSRYISKLKDYTLLMEFKKLKHQAPPGLYVLPSAHSLRLWHGVIFLRKGLYKNGIFKFFLKIPESYPDNGPRVVFISQVFHPLIDSSSGELDISIQFPKWTPNRDYIVLLLAYIKKIFYNTSYWEARPGQRAFNNKAQQQWISDKAAFIKSCELSVNTALEKVYENSEESSLQFSAPIHAHQEALKRILAQDETKAETTSFLQWFQDGVRKLSSTNFPQPSR